MANPKGHEASLVKFQPKWKHGRTTVIRVPVALARQILEYAHQLDQGQIVPLSQVTTPDTHHPFQSTVKLN